MKVSVICFTYNRGNYLPIALESYIKQDYNNKELIIVDDGSTDDTEAISKRYVCDTIKYYRIEHSGQPVALNYGIEKSSGELICQLHSDDILPSNSLSGRVKIFEQFKNYNLEVLYTDMQEVNVNLHPVKIHKCGEVNAIDIWEHEYIPMPSMMWRKKIHDKIGYMEQKLSDYYDLHFKIRCIMECNCIASHDIFYIYRAHSQQESAQCRRRGDCQRQHDLTLELLRARYERYNIFKK